MSKKDEATHRARYTLEFKLECPGTCESHGAAIERSFVRPD
jgi:hypothetical protein